MARPSSSLSRTGLTLVVALSALTLLCAPGQAAEMRAGRAPDDALARETVPADASSSSAAAAKWAPHRVLVQFRSGVSRSEARAAASGAGGRVVDEIRPGATKGGPRLAVVESSVLTTGQLVHEFADDPDVLYAEPDYVVRVTATPDDPRWDELWGMVRIGAPSAWDSSTGASDVVVAVVDTGVDYTHPDLADAVWTNPDEIAGNDIDDDGNGYVDDVHGVDTRNGDGDPMDDNRHGTHVAGTVAAVGDNGTGVTGVCWTAKIMACKSFSAGGPGYTSDAVESIDYVLEQKRRGVNVVALNASWTVFSYSQALKDAVEAAGEAGIITVAAAGNFSVDIDSVRLYPAAYDSPDVIAVAATDRFDRLAVFSDWGPASVDLAAPGVGIVSTAPESLSSSGYLLLSGTSMAAPHVTGAVALCAAAFPDDTMEERRSRILDNTDPVAALAGKCVTGGRLDVARALGVTPTDDDVPGVPLPPSPLSGSLDAASDADDVYSVFLKAGEVLHPAVGGPVAADVRLYLFAPDSKSVGDKTAAVAATMTTAYPRQFRYVAPSTGTYYLDVHAAAGSGSYHLTSSVVSDDTLPGVPAPASPIEGTLDESRDTSDVYTVDLVEGDKLRASLTGPEGTDFWLQLFSPGATSLDSLVGFIYAAYSGDYPRSYWYTARETGTFYVRAVTYGGDGAYTLTYSVVPAEPADDIPGVPAPASPLGGALGDDNDTSDVHAVHLTAGVPFQASLTGPTGEDCSLCLYGTGSTSVSTDEPVAEAGDGDYPRTLSYTPDVTGIHYLEVYQSGWASKYNSPGGPYTITYSGATPDTTAPTTSAAGIPRAWVSRDVEVTLSAVDDGWSGVARTEYRIGEGAWTACSAPVRVARQGRTTFSYRSVDGAGNVEAIRTRVIRIDRTRPTTRALRQFAVKRGGKAAFRFRVDDRTAKARIVIRILRKDEVVLRLRGAGWRATGRTWTYAWPRCTLRKGRYTWEVLATDEAGNTPSRVGRSSFVVM